MKKILTVLLLVGIYSQVFAQDTTIISDGYTIRFSKGEKFAKTNLYGDDEKRNELAKKSDNMQEGATYVEDYLKSKFGKYFSVKDTVLTLKLANGKTKKYLTWDKEKEMGYNFVNYFENIDYYLLRVQWYEGNEWLMVNRKNGNETYIGGEAYISPDKSKIAVINEDIEAAYSFNGIQLYSVGKDSLSREFSMEMQTSGPVDLKWKTANSFTIWDFSYDYSANGSTSGEKNTYRLVTFSKK